MLRAAGVCLALPWLESLAPKLARAQAASVPKRLIFISFPNGAAHQWWENAPRFGTSVAGDAFKLSRVLEPFAPIKNKTLVLSRLGNYTWRKDNGNDPTPFVEPSHSRCAAALTTCVDADSLANARGMPVNSAVINGVSFDQVIAQHEKFKGLTNVLSLQVGLGSKPGFFDQRSYSYNQVLSWKSGTEPLKRHINPKAVFDMLVSGGAVATPDTPIDDTAQKEAQRRALEEKSVLDAVRDQAASLKNRVSKSDQLIFDQYEQSLRELEIAVTRVGNTMGGGVGGLGCNPIAAPGQVPEPPGELQGLNNGTNGYNRGDHANVMNDLITMAIQCDVTRIITYMLDDSRSVFDYTHIGQDDRIDFGSPGGSYQFHDGAQHGPGNLNGNEVNGGYGIAAPSNNCFAQINRWLNRKVAELALKLEAMPEGTGTVLDNTVIVYVSEMRSHDHDCYDLPAVMLGGTGVFRANEHIAFRSRGSDRQLRDLYFTIMNKYFELGVPSFGDDTRGAPNALIEEILA